MAHLSHTQVWSACLAKIQTAVGEQDFATWFRDLKSSDLKGVELTVDLPSDFWKKILDEKYGELLKGALIEILGPDARLYYNINAVMGQKPIKQEAIVAQSPVNTGMTYDPHSMINPNVLPGLVPEKFDSHLDGELSFSNYVVGDCNKMAAVASREICKRPGKSEFNPIFIFGGPGLGKTHIANAIGLKVKEAYPEKKVLYVPASRFKMQYMQAAMNQELNDFLPYYSKIDVLVVDDIQDLNSPGAQNAFFTIFNNLHQMGKQLVFTSDRPQVELEEFEERLLSRFKWGLSVELSKPTYETRLSFLHNWCTRKGVSIDDEVLEYVARKVQSNFRDLYCVLNPLFAKSIFLNEDITVEMAHKVVEQLIGDNGSTISMDKVIDAVCAEMEVTRDELMGTSRKRKFVLSRQIIMYLSRELTSSSYNAIGRKIGGKDHSTVVHSCNTIADLIKVDREVRGLVTRIQRSLEC